MRDAGCVKAEALDASERESRRCRLKTCKTADCKPALRIRSKFGCDFFDGVTLDDVANLKFVEAVDTNAAFHARTDFVDFVLEAAEGLGDAFVNKALSPHDAHLAA